jgi:hypothetical protein
MEAVWKLNGPAASTLIFMFGLSGVRGEKYSLSEAIFSSSIV